jgi:tRNA(fMet)-specific endonuclease VapC
LILLDTDVLIEILDRKSAKGERSLRRILSQKESVGTTVISLHEILYGLHKFAKPVGEVLLLPVLGYTKQDAVLSSKLELDAERKGNPVRRADAMIAAISVNNAASLCTFDTKHFSPMTPLGLKLFT